MYFFTIVVLCFLFLETIGRPTHVLQDYDKDSKENSYRDGDSDETDDYLHSEQKSSMKQFAGNEPEQKGDLQYENEPSTNEEDQERPDKDYLENNEKDQEDTAHLTHDLSTGNDVKRTASYDNGILLFHDNEKSKKLQANEYSADDKVDNQNARCIKEYNLLRRAGKNAVPRYRRQTKNEYLNENIGSGKISTQKIEANANEDEETAIRRHIKKLSKEELDELLQSLSEDKRALLKNIIGNQEEYDSINKREITKKAGANEVNNLVGNEQSDMSKIQGGTANLEAESSISPNFEKSDDDSKNKLDPELMYSKSPENVNSSEKTSDKINILDSITEKNMVKTDNIENIESRETESKILGNSESEKETSKKENKREINSKSFIEPEAIIKEPAISKAANKEDLYCSDNDDISQLWNEESSLYNDNNKYKRETCSEDLNSIKSLEESFPNTDDSNKLRSDTAPLIRVKRNKPDKQVEKRDANVLSNIKVPYFSSVLENNEEGNEEGGEFEDEGFFERGAKMTKSNELAKRGIDISGDHEKNYIKSCGNSQPTYIDKNKLQTDTVGLGSDTDVVLSGIEGVDDNIMYNGVARIRRTGEASDNLNMENEIDMQQNKQQLGSQNEHNELSEDNNAVRYQENDAFGSLPRNYEQDLGRYKRIRRLKPESNVPTLE